MIALLLLLMADTQEMVYAAGYIPNVQFAPFYVAQQRGYYKEEGIELKMDYTMGPDVLKLAALNKVQIASVDPDAFFHARVRGMPVVHVATLYQSYPTALISREDILDSDKLKDKRVGVPGAYGASYLGLKAMLAEMGLKLSDIRLNSIGYNQVSALQNNRIDAVVGYVNNEPVRLKELGVETHVRMLSAGNQIPGVGLMTSQKFMDENPDLVAGFLRATFRGMHDVIKDPRSCFDLVVEHYLPELKAERRYEAEFRILEATLPYWKKEDGSYGQCPEEAWRNLADLLNEEQGSDPYKPWRDWVDFGFSRKP